LINKHPELLSSSGHGHQHVFTIRNKHKDVRNLQDLASMATTQYDYLHSHEIFALACAVIIFSGLAVASTALSDREALYLLAIMAVGTVGNALIAVLPQKPPTHGIRLESMDSITHDSKVVGTLQSLEQKDEGLGEPLLKELFPAGITKEAQAWFDDLKDSCKRALKAAKSVEVAKKESKQAVSYPLAIIPVDLDDEFIDKMFWCGHGEGHENEEAHTQLRWPLS
jgi:hypothetical protein